MATTSAYLDANIITALAKGAATWTDTAWGKSLKTLTDQGHLDVWASPGNCIELALVPDIALRNQMAVALNTLIRGQYMLPAYEFYIVEDLLRHVEANWPGSFRAAFFQRLKAKSARLYIGLLGQLAALPDYDVSKGFEGIMRPKLISQLIQASLFDDPKPELDKRLKAIQNHDFRQQDSFAAYDTMPLEELHKEVDAAQKKQLRASKPAVAFLKTNKAAFINGYALDELYSALRQVFEYDEELLHTVPNFTAIVADWAKVYPFEAGGSSSFRVKPLPPDLVQKFAERKANFNDCWVVIRELALRFHKFMTVPQIYNSTIFNELEQAFNHGQLPTWGLVLDCHHAVAAMYTEFFITGDVKLLNTVKSWHTRILPQAGYRETVDNVKDFERKVEKRLRELDSTQKA